VCAMHNAHTLPVLVNHGVLCVELQTNMTNHCPHMTMDRCKNDAVPGGASPCIGKIRKSWSNVIMHVTLREILHARGIFLSKVHMEHVYVCACVCVYVCVKTP
jgi:hypothetical protein